MSKRKDEVVTARGDQHSSGAHMAFVPVATLANQGDLAVRNPAPDASPVRAPSGAYREYHA